MNVQGLGTRLVRVMVRKSLRLWEMGTAWNIYYNHITTHFVDGLPLETPHLNTEGLDPKYLAPQLSGHNVLHPSVTPGVVRPQSKGEANASGGAVGTRAGSQQVPLLSAYFPKS